jgi:hypothetical protein
MSLSQTDMQYIDGKFGSVHRSIEEKNTAVVQRLTALETTVGGYEQPCALAQSLEDDVRDLQKQNARGVDFWRDNAAKVIVAIVVAILIGVGGYALKAWEKENGLRVPNTRAR